MPVLRRPYLFAAGLDRAAAAIPRAGRGAANGSEHGLPCRENPCRFAVPLTCAGLAGRRDLVWIARRIDIAGAPVFSVS